MTQRDLRSPLPGGEERDGGLLIRNARLLATGTWTDSAVGTPLFYPVETLRKCAANWRDNSYWSRHRGDVPRSIVEKIGIVQNTHYENDAVVGDIYLHGRTQESRDAINYILWARGAGIPVFSSVELVDEEVWNAAEGRYEATSVTFTGAACVNLGACTTCALPGGSSLEAPPQATAELEEPAPVLVNRAAGTVTFVTPLDGEPDPSPRTLADPPGIIVTSHGEVIGV